MDLSITSLPNLILWVFPISQYSTYDYLRSFFIYFHLVFCNYSNNYNYVLSFRRSSTCRIWYHVSVCVPVSRTELFYITPTPLHNLIQNKVKEQRTLNVTRVLVLKIILFFISFPYVDITVSVRCEQTFLKHSSNIFYFNPIKIVLHNYEVCFHTLFVFSFIYRIVNTGTF